MSTYRVAARGGLTQQAASLIEDARILADQYDAVLTKLSALVEEIQDAERASGRPAPVEPRLLSLAQAAIALGVSKSTVQRLVRDGELPTVQLRGTSRIPTAAIDQMARGEALRGA